MIDILLQNGDLVADRYGDISLCANENEDIIQTANNNIILRFRGNKFHSELGNKIYGKRIKANHSGIEEVRAECTNAIYNDKRIKDVKQINITLMDDASCLVDYVLVYINSSNELIEINSNIYIDAFNMMKGGEQ